jgi:hypothetical protein
VSSTVSWATAVEKLGQARGLGRRDQRDAVGWGRGQLADELVQPAGVARRTAPPEPHGVGAGAHAGAAVLGRERFDLRARDVGRREDRYGQALRGELVAPLLGLRLERVVR